MWSNLNTDFHIFPSLQSINQDPNKSDVHTAEIKVLFTKFPTFLLTVFSHASEVALCLAVLVGLSMTLVQTTKINCIYIKRPFLKLFIKHTILF